MAVYKHHGSYTFDFVRAKIRFRKSGFKTEEQAKDAEAEVRTKAKRMNTDLKQLLEMRLSALKKRSPGHYRDNSTLIKILQKRWKFKQEITRFDVKDFLDEVCEDKGPQRSNKYLAYIRALFAWAMKYDLANHNPAKGIDPEAVEVEDKYIPPLQDFKKVLSLANKDQADYLLFLAHTAARSNEINKLEWDDINLEQGYLVLKTRKSKFSNVVKRKIDINNSLKQVIEGIERKGKYVFFHPRTEKPYTYRRRFLKTLCKKAKVRVFTYHCIRHLSASIMVNDNISLYQIQRILGHARISTTDLYLKGLLGERSMATDSLDKIGGPPPSATTKGKDDA
jgi:integrase